MAGDSQQWEAPTFQTCDGVDERCSIEATVYGDYLNLGGCIFFVAAHALLLAAQAFLCWRGRKEERIAWSFVSFLGAGTAFEIMGYCARIAMTQDPWSYDAFVIQLLMLILGPTLAAASISVTFKHLVLWYGPTWSVLRPSLYPWVFVGTDFVSIVIQAAGTIIASIATEGEEFNQDLLDVGRGLLVAGVVFQAANMIFCGGLMLVYFFRRSKAVEVAGSTVIGSVDAVHTGQSDGTSGRPGGKTQEKRVNIFIVAIIVAYVAIITRCIYRYAKPFLLFLSFQVCVCGPVSFHTDLSKPKTEFPKCKAAGLASSCRTKPSSSFSTAP